MKVAIYQPNYFPPLHYMNRFLESDVFILLDDVQINRRVGQNKANIKLNGNFHTLTVPLSGGNRVKINNSIPLYDEFLDKHLKTIKQAYEKAPKFSEFYKEIESLFKFVKDLEKLNVVLDFGTFSYYILQMILRYMNIDKVILRSSEINDSILTGSDLMLYLTKRVGGTEYICGKPAYDNYLKIDDFAREGIRITVQDWKCPQYQQLYGDFIPNLSIIDLLMNVDIDKAYSILKG